jgi:hypothetical protein
MNGRIIRVLLWIGLLGLLSASVFAQERWVYRYNGSANSDDVAHLVVLGPDGNLYVAGASCGSGTSGDLTVVSLTGSGVERWVYRYNGPADNDDVAHSIALGPDGNLYVAGRSGGIGTGWDFMVVSLTDSGVERWVYRYNGPADNNDVAQSIVVGSDGNLYAAGMSYGTGTSGDFTVVSLTDSGVERWVYRYDGPSNFMDWANSIVMGLDGNLYVAGTSYGSGTDGDLTVVSLTDSGVERWVYRYDGPANYLDQANSIAVGSDSSLYVAGYSVGNGTDFDFTVVSLTDSGAERWVYRYDGSLSFTDWANSIVMGLDSNLYAVGTSYGTGTSGDLTVVSLTDSGVERWVYRYDGTGHSSDGAYSVITGPDGNLYSAGTSYESGISHDFAVVSLTDSGVERWVYRYNGSANSDDVAHSIVMGLDGNLYAAGYSTGDGTSRDFTVVSLPPEVGVEEDLSLPSVFDFRLFQNRANPFYRSTIISYSLPQVARVTLAIYDITGRLVEMLVNEIQRPGVHQVRWNRKDNPSGVYFYSLRAGEFVATRKMVAID